MGKTRFRGPVVGPLGKYVTINERFGHLALAAECALRGHVGLSAFVVTCKEDEKVPNPDPNPTPTPTPSPSPSPSPSPNQVRVTSLYLVGCDGPCSRVRELLGIRLGLGLGLGLRVRVS